MSRSGAAALTRNLLRWATPFVVTSAAMVWDVYGHLFRDDEASDRERLAASAARLVG